VGRLKLLAALLDFTNEETVAMVLQFLLIAKSSGSTIKPVLLAKIATVRPLSAPGALALLTIRVHYSGPI